MPHNVGGRALVGLAACGAGQDLGAGLDPAVFTEPNLSFIVDGRGGGRVRMQVCFSLESLPGWMPRDVRGGLARESVLRLVVTCSGLAEAARAWDRDRQPFPAR